MKHEIRKYIRKERRKGVSEEDILDAAIDAGYDEELVLEEMQSSTKIVTEEHIFAIVAIVLAVGAVFLVHSIGYTTTEVQEIPREEVPQPSTLTEQEQEEIFMQAIQNQDPGICSAITDDQKRLSCQRESLPEPEQEISEEEQIYRQALITNNPELCNQLDGEAQLLCFGEFQ